MVLPCLQEIAQDLEYVRSVGRGDYLTWRSGGTFYQTR
jgi:hypothetical protein